ncbi:MAG: hypothetical protein QM488_03935 [Rhizobiaceae bacterium]
MLDLFKTTIIQFQALPLGVSIWVNWMGALFMLAFVFAFKHKAARFALFTFFVLTIMGAMIAVWLTGSIHWIALVHLIVWPPLLVHLINREIRNDGFEPKSFYGVWVILLTITMVVSLLFDLRDVVLVFAGNK